MAAMFRTKYGFLSRLKSLIQSTTVTTTLQRSRFNHTLTTGMEGSDPVVQQNSIIDQSKWRKINAKVFGVTRSMIPSSPWIVLKILRDKGFEAYLVGGCVRDLLLNRIPKDFDVITTAKLKQVKKQFNRCEIIGRRFPICRVHIKDSIVEVSSFETVAQHAEEKEKILLSQIPSGCEKNDFILWRNSTHRDFTINSLFFDPFMNQICDYANGMADLRSLKLRTIIPAQLSFQEDCARILRGLRIAGRLGLSFSKDTEIAIRKFSSSVQKLDKSRIMMELNYMLSYGAAESTICLLRRFNLLEIFLPFHAAYLNQHASQTSQSPALLMKLFFNLDTLVSCDRPCACILWLGLLAFHQALVTSPQDALAIWVFASVLYHGKWVEGVKFARENAKLLKFAPEISGFSEFKSDEELAKEVSHFAAMVQDSVGAFVDSDILVQSMSKYPCYECSGLVFVSNKTANEVVQVFEVLVNDAESLKTRRPNYMIDYVSLGKGHLRETRFVLGKVILETLSRGLTKGGMEVVKKGSEVIEEKNDPNFSDVVKHPIEMLKHKKRILLPYDPEQKQRMVKKQKVVNVKCFSQQEVAIEKEEVVLKHDTLEMSQMRQNVVETSHLSEGELGMRQRDMLENKKHHLQCQEVSGKNHGTIQNEKLQDIARKHVKVVEKVKHHPLHDKETKQLNVSGIENLNNDKKMKWEKRKNCSVLSQEVVKEKTEKFKKEEKSGWPLLSDIFRR